MIGSRVSVPSGRCRAIGTGSAPGAVGPYGVMQGVLKKTVFKVEVAHVQVRVDRETQRKLASLAHGQHSPER